MSSTISTQHERDTMTDSPRQRKNILISVCIALMAVIASVSGLNVAQQHIALALNASQSAVLWMINIYAVSLAALLLPLGSAGDRWGRKPLLLLGLMIFGLSNIAAGLAPNTQIMLVSRLMSGIGAAMIMPVTLAVITSNFPKEERSKAIGIWTAVAGGGGLLGMFLSAVLVDLAHWRSLFILPVVLVIIAFFMTLRSVPNSRIASQHKFDTVGTITSIIAIVGLIFTLDEGPKAGWDAPLTLLGLIIGIVGTILFVFWELRYQEPLLDLRLFRKRSLASGSLSLLVLFGVQSGVFIVLFPYFQAVLGWSGLLATTALMPMALAMMICSGIAPRLAQKLGPQITMALGVFLSGIGLILMSTLVAPGSGYLKLLPGMIAWGIGTGLAMAPSTEAITASLPQEQQGVASALNDITREFGTALGVALLGAVFSTGYHNAINTKIKQFPPEIASEAGKGIATAFAAANDAGEQSEVLIQAAQSAFISGWQQAMLSGGIVMAILFIYILLQGPPNNSTSTFEAP